MGTCDATDVWNVSSDSVKTQIIYWETKSNKFLTAAASLVIACESQPITLLLGEH